MNKAEEFQLYRKLLFTIAYKMTGRVEDSEDLVQDVFEAWLTRSTEVTDPKAYLAKATLNKTLNYLKQRQKERECYVGIWLPEPLPDSKQVDTDDQDLQYGFLMLFEKLSPIERAVFLLREGFDINYKEIAETFDLKEDHCRQLYHRSKEKLNGRKRYYHDRNHKEIMFSVFEQAIQSGDLSLLISQLKEDVVSYSDGGGKAAAALKAIIGRETVTKFLQGIYDKTGQYSVVKFASFNGSPAAVIQLNNAIDTIMVMEADEKGIAGLYFIRNPEKIKHL